MSLRILHTSDWHLGLATGAVSRHEDHRRFLDWLIDTLEARKVDALVIAGDVFDTFHPSSEALSSYYGFLARVPATGVQNVVVVGGNHDSPAQLNAPREVLTAMNVHVVGGVPPAGDDRDRLLIPLQPRGSPDPTAVCLGVPFVHEYRLGVRTTDPDPTVVRAAFREAFAGLYTDLVDRAEARFPELPILATGHLTLGTGSRRDDYPQEIHQVGTIEGLPTSIIDDRIRYVALGHIHRAYPVHGSVAQYSGSPIPCSVTEMNAPRQVLIVDLPSEGPAEVQPVDVPVTRGLVTIEGPVQDVLQELRSLTWDTPLPPLVFVQVITDSVVSGLSTQLHECLDAHPESARPALVHVQQRAATHAEETAAVTPTKALEELEPSEVFDALLATRTYEDATRSQLRRAFDQIVQVNEDDFSSMLEDVTGGSPTTEAP